MYPIKEDQQRRVVFVLSNANLLRVSDTVVNNPVL